MRQRVSPSSPFAITRSADPYRRVLRAPGAAAFFAAALPVRLGSAMQSLGLVLLVHGGTGSFGAAGLVSGAFSLSSAVASPRLARVMDRVGQSRVLLPCLAVYGPAMGLVLLTAGRSGALPVTAGCAAVAGAAAPQIGALTAARWSALLRGDPALATAFTLESLGNDMTFLLGPALLGVVGALASPVAAMGLAWLLVLSGGLVFALQKGSAPVPAPARPGRSGRAGQRARDWLLRPASAVLVCVNLVIGMFFGTMQLSVSAFAQAHGSAAVAGPLYSAMSVSSLVSGLGFGLVAPRLPRAALLSWVLAYIGAACLLSMAAGSPLGLAFALAAVGLGISPALVLSAVLAETVYPSHVLTEAFTWLTSVGVAGAALATGVAGRVVQLHGATWGFALAAGVTLVAVPVVLAGRGSLVRPTGGVRAG